MVARQTLLEPDSERFFAPVFVALLALFQWPVWTNRFLPMVDVPGHLATARILHDLASDPESHFHRWFVLRPGFTPYVGFFWFVEALARAGVPIETAGRLYVALCVAGVPLAVLGLLVAFGRSRWLALFALPLSYSMLFVLGFVNTLAGNLLAVAALAMFALRLQGRAQGSLAAAATAALPVLCVINHPQPFVFFLCGLGVLAVAHRDRLSTLVLALPAVILGASWIVPVLQGRASPRAGHWQLHWDPLRVKLASLDNELTNVFVDRLDFELLRASCLLFVLLAVVAFVRFRRGPSRWPSRQTLVALALAGGAVVAYFWAPRAMLRGPAMHLFVYQRFALLAAMLVIPLLAIPRATLPRWAVGLLCALSVAHGAYLASRLAAFDREADGFETIAAAMEEGSCYAPLWNDAVKSTVVKRVDAFAHFGQHLTAWKGAFPGFPFAIGFQMPVAIKRPDGTPAAWDAAGYPVVWPHEVENARKAGSILAGYPSHRYFLVPRGHEERFGADLARLERAGEGGPFVLWRNPEATCP